KNSGGTLVDTFSTTLAIPTPTTPSTQAVLDGTFTVGADGQYQITLTDLQFPAALSSSTPLSGVLVEQGTTNITLLSAGPTAATLSTGKVSRIFAAGVSDNGPGLFSAQVTAAGSGALAYSSTISVGAVTKLTTVNIAAGTYPLTAADLQYPSALSQFG